MKLNVQHLNIRSFDSISGWVGRQMQLLAEQRQIDEANVRLERLPEASPAFHVHMHLVTPGPDVFAETRDHTLQAAIGKAIKHLREQISCRSAKRLQRLKSNLKTRRGQ